MDDLVLEELSINDRNLLDSGLTIYAKAKSDTSKIEALNFICDNLVSDVWSDYQFIQRDLIEVALTKDISDKELSVIETHKGGSLNNLGLYYEYQEGNSSLALEYYLKALKLFEKIKDENGEAMMLNRMGTLYAGQDDTKKGLEYFQKSLAIYEVLSENKEISNPLNNLGLYYQQVGDFPKALLYFKKSLSVDESNNNMQGSAISLSNIGRVYMGQKKYDKALIPFINSLNIFKKMEDKNGIALVSTNIGQVYYVQGDMNSAYVNAKRSFDIANEVGALNRIGASASLLSNIYEKQNKVEEAYQMYKISIQTRDSLTNESTKANAIKQQSKYEYEKQKAIDDAINEKQQQKQEVITYAIGFGLALVVAFLIFVFNRLQVTRKQKLIIEDAHEELSEKNNEILDSITYAKRIQNAILPPDGFVKEHLPNSFIYYQPKDIVAGDFYWVKNIIGNGLKVMGDEKITPLKTQDSSLVLFAAADCTGHGVPGAMVSVVCNNALNRSIKEYKLTDPGKILDKTREIVIEEFSASNAEKDSRLDYVKDGMDIALCAFQKDFPFEGGERGMILKYAGANNPLWIVRKGEILITKANKQPIGRFRSSEPFRTHTVELQKEDVIYIFTDGYVDQFGGANRVCRQAGGKKFMAKAFKELILAIQNESMEEQKNSINKALLSWKGELEQVDDICVIGVRI